MKKIVLLTLTLLLSAIIALQEINQHSISLSTASEHGQRPGENYLGCAYDPVFDRAFWGSVRRAFRTESDLHTVTGWCCSDSSTWNYDVGDGEGNWANGLAARSVANMIINRENGHSEMYFSWANRVISVELNEATGFASGRETPIVYASVRNLIYRMEFDPLHVSGNPVLWVVTCKDCSNIDEQQILGTQDNFLSKYERGVDYGEYNHMGDTDPQFVIKTTYIDLTGRKLYIAGTNDGLGYIDVDDQVTWGSTHIIDYFSRSNGFGGTITAMNGYYRDDGNGIAHYIYIAMSFGSKTSLLFEMLDENDELTLNNLVPISLIAYDLLIDEIHDVLYVLSSNGLKDGDDAFITRVDMARGQFEIFTELSYSKINSHFYKGLLIPEKNTLLVGGYRSETRGGSGFIKEFELADCDVTCSACLQQDNSYCGRCFEGTSATCTTFGQCSGDFSQSGVCPFIANFSPKSGPGTGGTVVTVSGGTTIPSTAYCRWIDNTNAVIRNVAVTFVQGSTKNVQCTSPPNGGKSELYLYIETSLNSGEFYGGSGLTFDYYDCGNAGLTTCELCFSEGSECGWCFGQGKCTEQDECTKTSSPAGFLWNNGPTCPKVNSISPTRLKKSGDTVSVTLSQVDVISAAILPTGWSAQYICQYSSPFQQLPATQQGIVLTCSTPTGASHDQEALLNIYLEINDGTKRALTFNRYTVDSSFSFSYYGCESELSCTECQQLPSCGYNNAGFTCTDTPDSTIVCPTLNLVTCCGHISGGDILTWNTVNVANGGLECVWSNAPGTPRTPAILSGNTITCTTPAIVEGNFLVHVEKNLAKISSSFDYESYDCSNKLVCGECTLGEYSRCWWCDDGYLCTKDDDCSGTDFALCPVLDTNSYSDAIQGGTNIVFTGVNFPVSDPNLNCGFRISSGDVINLPVEKTLTSVICTTPSTPGAEEAEFYLASSATPLTASIPITFYDCTSNDNCDDCFHYERCGYCDYGCDVACYDIISECPALSSLVPFQAKIGTISSVDVIGSGFEEQPYYCYFTQTSTSDILQTLGTYIDETRIRCGISGSFVTGTYSLQLFAQDREYTENDEFLTLFLFDCESDPEDCAACNRGTDACGYCLSSGDCVAQVECPSNLWLDVCPTVISTDPTTTDGREGQDIRIQLESGIDLTTADPNAFQCKWGSFTYSGTFDSETPNTFICTSKNDISNDVSILYNGFSLLQYEYPITECSGYSCSECSQLPECGWCLNTNQCETVGYCSSKWLETSCPSITSISFNQTNNLGLIHIIIRGNNFVDSDTLEVRFGPFKSPNSIFVDENTIVSLLPAGVIGDIGTITIYVGRQEFATFTSDLLLVDTPEPPSQNAGIIALIIILILLLILGVGGFLIWFFIFKEDSDIFNLNIDMTPPDYHEVLFGVVTPPESVPSDNFEFFEDTLIDNLPLFLAFVNIADPADQDKLAKGLVYMTERHKNTLDYIIEVITLEIQGCNHANTIFRGNSMASRMFKEYARLIGLPYVFETIGQFVRQLEALGARKEQNEAEGKADKKLDVLDIDIEVDTNKMTDQSKLEEHKIQMRIIVTKILRAIYNSVDLLPIQFRLMFNTIRDEIINHFGRGDPNTNYWAVGGLFFLRFLVPAIFFPSSYGLTNDIPNETASRQLTLISKIVQSIGNISTPGKKEPYLHFMSDFIEEHIPRVCEFYERIMVVPAEAMTELPVAIPDAVILSSRATVYKIFNGSMTKLKQSVHDSGHYETENMIRDIEEIENVYRKESFKKKKKTTKMKPKK